MAYENDILDAPDRPVDSSLSKKALVFGVVVGLGLHLLFAMVYWFLSRVAGRVPEGFFWNLIPFSLCGIWSVAYLRMIQYRLQDIGWLFLCACVISFLSMLGFLYVQEGGDWSEVIDKPHIYGYPALSMLLIEWLTIFSWIWIHYKETRVLGTILLGLTLFFLMVNS